MILCYIYQINLLDYSFVLQDVYLEKSEFSGNFLFALENRGFSRSTNFIGAQRILLLN